VAAHSGAACFLELDELANEHLVVRRSSKSAHFRGGAIRGNLHLAESQHEQALIAYKQAIQHAFGDVSDALIAYQNFMRCECQEQVVKICRSRSASHHALQGVPPLISKCWTVKGRFLLRNSLGGGASNEYQSLVQLYRALGGGWQ